MFGTNVSRSETYSFVIQIFLSIYLVPGTVSELQLSGNQSEVPHAWSSHSSTEIGTIDAQKSNCNSNFRP